jgi:hypothetical protein
MNLRKFSNRSARTTAFALGIFLLFGVLDEGQAQERFTYWKAELPGGTYVVSHAAISSISMSNYVVDGVLRVTEVAVGTMGSVQGRFYFIEESLPSSPVVVGQSALEDLKARAREVLHRVEGVDPEGEVVKNYPTSTHAHTVEFRLTKLEDLQRLYQNLEDSFLNRRTATFRP